MAVQHARIWRRGPVPTPAGADGTGYGYFGPGSQVWRVMLHPVVAAFIEPVTALLELLHLGLQAASPFRHAAQCIPALGCPPYRTGDMRTVAPSRHDRRPRPS